MNDINKICENLHDLGERLWEEDIQGYGWYIEFIEDAIKLLKKQDNEIDTLKTLLLGMKGEVNHNE